MLFLKNRSSFFITGFCVVCLISFSMCGGNEEASFNKETVKEESSIHANQPEKKAAPDSSNLSSKSKKEYRIETYQNETGGFGYDIYADKNLYIHQPHIPAVSGNMGFKTKEDASKVAELIVEKINKNILPPTITIEELKQLSII